MPRTKQTKPRHYVDDQKTNLGGISSCADSPEMVDNHPEKLEKCQVAETDQDNSCLSETEDKISHLSTSPCLYDENQDKNTFSTFQNDADSQSDDVERHVGESEEHVVCQNTKVQRDSESPSSISSKSDDLQKPASLANQPSSPQGADQQIIEDKNRTETAAHADQNNFINNTLFTPDQFLPYSSNINSVDSEQPLSLKISDCQNARSDKSSPKYSNISQPPNGAVASQYFETLKKLYQSEASKQFDLNSEAWKAWMNPNQYAADYGFSNNSNLVNGYMKQIFDYWQVMAKDPPLNQALYYPYQYASTAFSNKLPQPTPNHNLNNSSSRCSAEQENSVSSAKVENYIEKEHLTTSNASPSSNAVEQESQNGHSDHEEKPLCLEKSKDTLENRQATSKTDNLVSPNSLPSAKDTPSPSSLSSFSDQRSNSTKSAQPQSHEKQAQSLTNPFYPYQSWPSSAWLGYPGLSGLSNTFPYPSSAGLLSLSKPSRQSPTSYENSHTPKNISSPVTPSKPANSNSNIYDSQAAAKNRTEPTIRSSSKIASFGNNPAALEAVKREYNAPYMPYNSYWLGSVLPYNSTMPASYTGMSLNSKKNDPKMLYPRDLMQFSGLSLPPSGPSSYFSDSLYKRTPSSVNKILNSRRSRSRTSAFDTVHAAIVREAKEQSKGVDPENMYIQCPICQKRIKRLYHFQRHMRIHTGEKTHQCPCCQYKSVRKDNLKSHMKTHEKQSLEGGRKNGKLPYQSNSNSANSLEKTPNHSPRITSSHKSTDKVSKVTAILSQDGCLNLSVQKSCRDLSIADNNPVALALSKSQFSDNVTDQNSVIDEYNKQAGRVINKMSPKLSPNLSQTCDDNLKRVLSDVALKNEYVEDRGKITDISPENHTFVRPKSEPISDSQHGTEKKTKKRELIFHALQYSGNEIISKRRKLSRESPKSGSSLSPSATNINNNNDRSELDSHASNEQPLCLSTSTDKSFAEKPENAKDETTAQTMNNKWLNFDKKDVATLAEMSLNQSQAYRLQLPEKMMSFSSSLVQNQMQSDKSPASSTGSQSQLAEDTSTHSQFNKTKLLSTGPVENKEAFPTAPPPLFYPSCSPMSFLSPSKYQPMSLGATLPPSYSSSLHKSLLQTTTSRVRKELSSKIKSKENGTDLKTEKDKSVGSSSPKTLQCRLCSFSSLSNAELQSHVTAKHKQNGFYKCEECAYLGKNLSKLVEHIRIHTGERPFKCDQCNYAAKRKDNLAQHKAVRHDKRKAKSGSHYQVMPDLKHDSMLAAHLAQATQYEKGSFGAQNSHGFSPNASNLYSNAKSAKKDQDPSSNPPKNGPLASPLHSFASIQALPSSLFQYPYYRFPSALNSNLSGNVPKTVNNPSSYSIKVRAALIAP